MKIRVGYVTNSSSTNFLIISKKELTPEYLFKKLGLKKGSIIEPYAMELCENIVAGTKMGIRHSESQEISYDNIKENYGEYAAEKYRILKDKGYNIYVGYTSSDEDVLTGFFTTDSFEIDEKDIYINGRECVW